MSDASTDGAVLEPGDSGGPDGGAPDGGASDGGTDGGEAGDDPGAAPTVAWVLSYFGNDQNLQSDSLHLAYSLDGLRWIELNAGQPVYQLSGFGTNHIRDPFLLRKQDGGFVYLATDWTLAENDSNYWNRPSGKLVMVDSPDLLSFGSPRLVQVTNLRGPGSSAMHAWAPEGFFDPERGEYGILWSGNDTSGRNRIYVSYTKDFVSVSNPDEPATYFDPGYSVIDATLVLAGSRNYLVFKDETALDIQIARSQTSSLAPGGFSRMSPEFITRGTNQTVGQVTEGPFVIKIPDQDVPDQDRWVLYADRYSQGGQFGGWTTTALDVAPSGWAPMTTGFSFPPGVRHANTVRVTQAELDALIARYGQPATFRIKTTYSEGGTALYVAHSWYHSMITTLTDTAHGQLSGDFRWRAVPGLADPSDPSLVSFIPAGHPGRYLRINSQNPTVYPPCTSSVPPNPANRGTALCQVPTALQHHLAWVDVPSDDDTFRSDATFRKVPARNGDPSMVSFQWYGDASRYLRHLEYQVFATPLSPPPATDDVDASFTLEQE